MGLMLFPRPTEIKLTHFQHNIPLKKSFTCVHVFGINLVSISKQLRKIPERGTYRVKKELIAGLHLLVNSQVKTF